MTNQPNKPSHQPNEPDNQGYQSPLDELLKVVVARKSAALTEIMENAFEGALRTTAFKQELRDAFDKKLAKILLSSFEGEIERRANKLREDPGFRAKIVVAIDAAIKSVP